MDSQMHDDEKKDKDDLVFQDLTPEQPATSLQRNIIRIQRHWPPHWSKRQRLLGGAVFTCFLIFLLVYAFIHIPVPPNDTTVPTTSNSTATTVTQMLSYGNVLYVLMHQTTNKHGQLEALDVRTGKLTWSYTPYNTEDIKIVGNILYIQTDTSLVALNASTRQQLWEMFMTDDNYGWQVSQSVLFTLSTSGTMTVINAATGTQLWQKQQAQATWQVDHNIFYMQLATNFGLAAFDAQNGQLLWYDPNAGLDWTPGNGNVYLKDTLKQRIEALDGQNGKQLWQFNTRGEDPELSIQGSFLFLTNAQQTEVEVLNDQTGKLLWQRPGTLYPPTEQTPAQIVISSQKNEVAILRVTDGTILTHFQLTNLDNPSVVTLLALKNGIAFFLSYTQNGSVQYTDPKIVAVRTATGAIIWSSHESVYISPLQNNAINIVPVGNDAILSLRADNGDVLWRYIFDNRKI